MCKYINTPIFSSCNEFNTVYVTFSSPSFNYIYMSLLSTYIYTYIHINTQIYTYLKGGNKFKGSFLRRTSFNAITNDSWRLPTTTISLSFAQSSSSLSLLYTHARSCSLHSVAPGVYTSHNLGRDSPHRAMLCTVLCFALCYTPNPLFSSRRIWLLPHTLSLYPISSFIYFFFLSVCLFVSILVMFLSIIVVRFLYFYLFIHFFFFLVDNFSCFNQHFYNYFLLLIIIIKYSYRGVLVFFFYVFCNFFLAHERSQK